MGPNDTVGTLVVVIVIRVPGEGSALLKTAAERGGRSQGAGRKLMYPGRVRS